MKKAIGSLLVILTSLITLLTPSLALASQSTDSINAGMPTNVSEMNLKILDDRGWNFPILDILWRRRYFCYHSYRKGKHLLGCSANIFLRIQLQWLTVVYKQ